MEPGYSDSASPISEPPDITNWFSSYVYESFALASAGEESDEIELNGLSVGEEHKENLGVAAVSKPMNKSVKQILSDTNLYESLPSEPPDIGNWFSSYVYESPMLDTSDGLEFSVPGEIECVKETQAEEETTILDRNDSLFEQELVSSAKVTDFSHSQSLLSEPPDVRNWFSTYEYQSPQLSDIHELGFSSLEKDQLIIDESDTEEEVSSGIFRKIKTKQETIAPCKSRSNGCNENIAADMTKEVSTSDAYSNQEMEKNSSARLFNASTKEVEEESSFKQEPLFCETKQEPSFSPGVSRYNPKPQSLIKHEAYLQELRPKHIQDTISMSSSSRENSPRNASQKACLEENLEAVDQESDDKENAHGKSTETGFVTMKKARYKESRDTTHTSSMTKPTRGVLVECSRSRELKKNARKEDKVEEERKKKRRVLGEMTNLEFSGAEETAGKWLCPQKNKGKLGPPLKQLRLDAWIHKA